MKKDIVSLKTIVIVGGGSAGYFTALYLKKKFPDKKITIIESPNIPVIGVGEATTPVILNFLHKTLGYSVQEFFAQTKPTFKLGIQLHWGKSGKYYYNDPFGATEAHNAIYYTNNINNCSLSSMLMDDCKAPFIKNKNGEIKPIKIPQGFAYHIDNKSLVKYLQTKLQESGCFYIRENIEKVVTVENKTGIKNLITDKNEVLTYDIYIDCSGFASLLLGKSLEQKWIDYSPSLKTNRAIIGTREHLGDIKPFTTATTLNHGWLWNIPTQLEDHLGYVFSKEFCSDDEAFHELRQHCSTVNNEKIISFKPGRYEKSWVGNTIGIGNAFAFVEPLESTGIHMILQQIKKIGKKLESTEELNYAQEDFNKSLNNSWDFIKWFIALHFHFNKQIDSPFWRNCNTNIDISGAQDYVDYFMKNGPIYNKNDHDLHKKLNIDNVFGAYSFDIHLIGCGINEQFFLQNKKQNSEQWPTKFAINKALVQKAIPHAEALQFLMENPCDFIADWFNTPL